MRIAICDDDECILDILVGYIRRWISVQAISVELYTYTSGKAFILGWEQYGFDFAFLDIQMEGLTGIDAARFIRNRNTHMSIAFVTNHRQYAIQGYEVQASYYLPKPVSAEVCEKTLNHMLLTYRRHKQDVFMYHGMSEAFIAQKADILYCVSDEHYIDMYLKREEFTIRMTMGEMGKELCYPRFYRCHKSYIVNLLNIKRMTREQITMINGDSVPVSKGCWNELRECYVKAHMGADAAGNFYRASIGNKR